jgi:hypothetical protein
VTTDARERGKNARPLRRAELMPANSIPTGYCRTLQPLAPQGGVRPLTVQEDLVDAVADVDVPDAETARRFVVKVLPSTTPFLLV